jgi:hypothetical protein
MECPYLITRKKKKNARITLTTQQQQMVNDMPPHFSQYFERLKYPDDADPDFIPVKCKLCTTWKRCGMFARPHDLYDHLDKDHEISLLYPQYPDSHIELPYKERLANRKAMFFKKKPSKVEKRFLTNSPSSSSSEEILPYWWDESI